MKIISSEIVSHWWRRHGWEVLNLNWNHNPLNSTPPTGQDRQNFVKTEKSETACNYSLW